MEAAETRPSFDLGAVPRVGEVYVETPLDDTLEDRLDHVAELGLRAKVGAEGAAEPDAESLALFIRSCRGAEIVFKATAGLHHAVRSDGEHGFLNLLAAVVFGDEVRALDETDPAAFELDAESFSWRGRSASAGELAAARRETPLDRELQLLRAGRGARGARGAPAVTGESDSGFLLDGGRAQSGLSGRAGCPRPCRAGLGDVFEATSLNPFLALGRSAWESTLARSTGSSRAAPSSFPSSRRRRLPFVVGDYVDFYSSLEHATNLGRLFRPDAEPLLPNWRHLPVGYHGRSGTVVVSGTPVVRPCGQTKGPDDEVQFGPTRRLDIELELAFVVGVGRLGEPVSGSAFQDHVFGVVLVNDWSARDIQAWEYQPLGPFLGKSFATSISIWVTPLALLEDRFVAAPAQDPEPLPYLRVRGDWALDIELEVELSGTVVSRTNARGLYWTMPQQLAHGTVNGASIATGDLLASGTISARSRGARARSSSSRGTALTRFDWATAVRAHSSRTTTR